MASTVCVSRCRLLAKLEINRGLCLSPILRDLSSSRESWCRRWRPARRSFFTSVCVHGSKATPAKVDHEKSEAKPKKKRAKKAASSSESSESSVEENPADNTEEDGFSYINFFF